MHPYKLLTWSAAIVTLAGLSIGVSNCEINRRTQQVKMSRENIALVDRCMGLASGEDGVLDFEESVKLARGLGYNKAILRDERVVLEPRYDKNPVLYLGPKGSPRDLIEVTPYLMEFFIKTRDPKIISGL